jgi:carboxypeptidase T
MKRIKQLFPHFGIISTLAAGIIYFSVNGFNYNTDVQTTGPQEKYSEVRIFATNDNDVKRMTDAGLIIEHANTKIGQYMDAWLSQTEISMLQKSGVPYQVLIDNWQTYYDNQPKMTPSEIEAALQQSKEDYEVYHSIYGSMGGYLTYSEVVAKLDSMRTEYPNYISQKFSIGTTWESRTVWAVRITKNPGTPTGRPEVMYHALIHAREPESMETQFYYFYWLFENYGTDPVATYILNNREIYWVPVLNPDGYVYNQTIQPGGGGMWRENRRFNSGSCYGVDLNRNYGLYQYWNSSNGGSSVSPTCGQGTYRGPYPFSEPETQSIMNFVNSRNFNASFGAHTYGNYLIKPWAWIDPQPTPDDNKFNQFLSDMKASNPIYTTGTPSQTVGYFVRGGSDDWYYNDSTHAGHHVFGITPETGTSFWPPQSQIIPLAQGMLFNNQYMSLIAGPYVNPLSTTFNQPTYNPGQSGTYKVVFRNKGLMTANNVRVIWNSASSNITIPTTQYVYPSLASFATDSATFNFTVSANAPNNCAITTNLTIKLDTTTIYTTPAYVLVGTGTVILNDPGNTFSNWTTNLTWNVTTAQFFSAPSSFTDSPGGNYQNNTDNSMTLAAPINATLAPVMILSFYHRYATEAGYDFCSVEVSSNNGTTWQPVASYSGTLSTWTQQTFDITNYAAGSSQVKIRFRLTSDAGLVADGWYVDDIVIKSYCGILSGITQNNGIPKTFALEQNYPNPFNPTTVIKYQLPKSELVTIKIYDVLGRQVASLINEKKDAGYYEITFDASSLSSGVYFYKIEAGDFVESKKMMVLK